MIAADDQAIVITGCGWVTPFGVGDARDRLPGVPALDTAASPPVRQIPTELLDRFPPVAEELRHDRAAWMAGLAFELACRSAGVDRHQTPPERIGLVLGSALAGQPGMIQFAEEVRAQSARFVSPIHFPNTVGNFTAGAIARVHQLRGPNLTLAGGAACGLEALVRAAALIADGSADVVVAGGVETITEALALGFDPLTPPLSEGACLYVLVSRTRAAARSATIMALIESCSTETANDSTPLEHDDAVVVTAGFDNHDALSVESILGRGLAAAGAATVLLAAQWLGDECSQPDTSLASIQPHGSCARVIAVARTDCHESLRLSLRIPIPPAGAAGSGS